jgi:6-phosphogluconate dehydrogenase (decarboxylating)
MRVGVIGGGSGIASSLKAAGIDVVGYAAGGQVVDDGMQSVSSYVEFLEALDYPRRYVLDLPAGPVVDNVIDEAYQTMEPGDVVIDPTPSYWGDTLRRYRRMRHRSLFYQDVACFSRPAGPSLVVSGDAKGLPISQDVLEAWAKPGLLEPVAGAGFAHYLAMVEATAAVARRGVDSEMAQLIEAYPGEVSPDAKAAFCPPKGSSGVGRAGWVLDDAVRLEAAIPLLALALMQGLGDSLDDHASRPPPPRGAFVHPDDIL